MCTTKPVTEDSLTDPSEIVGIACPLCTDGSTLAYMKFADPHGMYRVDPELFECTPKRHSFTIGTRGLRLLASDGTMTPPREPEFVLSAGELKQS